MTNETNKPLSKLKHDVAYFVKLVGTQRVARWAGVSQGHAARWKRQEFLPSIAQLSAIWAGFQREFQHDEDLLRKIIHDFKQAQVNAPAPKSRE